MNCPDIETLIGFAMNPLACEDDELAVHIHSCPKCRVNLRLVNGTMLAPDWCSPRTPVDVGEVIHPGKSSGNRVLGPPGGGGTAQAESYIEILDRDIRDSDGAWMRKGQKVLRDPEDPERIVRATSENIKKFAANGYSLFRHLKGGALDAIDAAKSETVRFAQAARDRLAALRGTPVPAEDSSFLARLLPFMRPKFGDPVELAPANGVFAQWLAAKSMLPSPGELPPAQRAAVCDANVFRAWEIRAGSKRFRWYAAFVTPIAPATLLPLQDVSAVQKAVEDFVREWERRAAGGAVLPPAKREYLTLATPGHCDDPQPIPLKSGG